MLPVATALAPMAGASLGTAGTLAGLGGLGGFLSGLGQGGFGGFLGGLGNSLTGLPLSQLFGGANTPMSSIGGLFGQLLPSGNLANLGQAQMLGNMMGGGQQPSTQNSPEDVLNAMSSSVNPIPVDLSNEPMPITNAQEMMMPLNTNLDPRMFGLGGFLASNLNSRQIF